MLFKKQDKITSEVSAPEYLDELNQRVYDAIEANEILEDFEKVEYTPTELQNVFALPDNYTEDSLVEAYIDGEETTDFEISFENSIYIITFSESFVNSEIVIKCKNFKQSFINKIVDIVIKNMPVG